MYSVETATIMKDNAIVAYPVQIPLIMFSEPYLLSSFIKDTHCLTYFSSKRPEFKIKTIVQRWNLKTI